VTVAFRRAVYKFAHLLTYLLGSDITDARTDGETRILTDDQTKFLYHLAHIAIAWCGKNDK